MTPRDESASAASTTERGYCGCCGNEMRNPDALWCYRCTGSIKHLSREGHLWERTYEARTGQPCPFQVGTSS